MSWNFYNLHYTVSALLSDRQLIIGMSLPLTHHTEKLSFHSQKGLEGCYNGNKVTKLWFMLLKGACAVLWPQHG